MPMDDSKSKISYLPEYFLCNNSVDCKLISQKKKMKKDVIKITRCIKSNNLQVNYYERDINFCYLVVDIKCHWKCIEQ